MSGTVTDLTALTAADTAARVAAGDVSAVEVTRAHPGADRVDPALHAFLYVDVEGALAAATVDDARVAGSRLGPLAGVPLALKDVLTMRACPRPAALASSTAGDPRTTRPSSAGCARPGRPAGKDEHG